MQLFEARSLTPLGHGDGRSLVVLAGHVELVHQPAGARQDRSADHGPVRSGNLLGNLLCGIAGLLDGNAPGGALANVLNRLLPLLWRETAAAPDATRRPTILRLREG